MSEDTRQSLIVMLGVSFMVATLIGGIVAYNIVDRVYPAQCECKGTTK